MPKIGEANLKIDSYRTRTVWQTCVIPYVLSPCLGRIVVVLAILRRHLQGLPFTPSLAYEAILYDESMQNIRLRVLTLQLL